MAAFFCVTDACQIMNLSTYNRNKLRKFILPDCSAIKG